MAAERIESRALPVYVSLAEHHAMLRACKTERDKLLLSFMWHTGGRISEVLQARVGDITQHGIRLVNLKQGRWQKQADGTKRHISIRKEKHVLLHANFLAELRAACKGKRLDEYIITRLDGPEPITRQNAFLITTSISKEAGIYKRRFADGDLRPLSPHKWRHGNAVNLLENDVPFSIVGDQLGHGSPRSTAVYTKIVDPRKAELIARVQF